MFGDKRLGRFGLRATIAVDAGRPMVNGRNLDLRAGQEPFIHWQWLVGAVVSIKVAFAAIVQEL